MRGRNTFYKSSFFTATLVILASRAAWAFAPPTVNYQGYLTNTDGSPLDTTVQMVFSLYDEEGSATALWSETHVSVTVTDGIFEVKLGTHEEPLGSYVFADAITWLGITVGDNSEMTPRTQFTSVPYALRIETVDGAAGGVINGKLNVGTGNSNSGMYAMVAGLNNHADGNYSVIAGGGGTHPLEGNSAGYYSVVGGGKANIAGEDHCVVGGGFNNTASNVYATVGGGTDNTASGFHGATVAGGSWNEAIGQGTTVSGGRLGRARGAYSVVAGGGGIDLVDSNSAIGDGSNVSGGSGNAAFGIHSVISGGRYNRTQGYYSVVGGGGSWMIEDSNAAIGNWSTVSGGRANHALNEYCSVGGGLYNTAITDLSTVAGGYDNNAGEYNSTICGGWQNEILDNGSFAFIGGGQWNTCNGSYSTVGGGSHNFARASFSTVAGGGGTSQADSNSASGVWSTIGGGRGNRASGEYSTIGGGRDNRTLESDFWERTYATIAGGHNNEARGYASTVAGGEDNVASGSHSFAAGYRAYASSGSFVWADESSDDYVYSGANGFVARAHGGVWFGTGVGSGATLSAGGSTWNAVSDSTRKQNIRLVNTKEMLDKVVRLPIKQWSYKSQDPSIEHIGPMAQDFWNAFHVGDDSLSISTIDPSGVALAAIQELAKRCAKLEQQNLQLQAQIQSLLAGDKQANSN